MTPPCRLAVYGGGDGDGDGTEDDELACPSMSCSADSGLSSDLTDDADSASPPPPPPPPSCYEMSSLMACLPVRRGLSRYYDGKSQSFTSLSRVRCLEDLAKPARKGRGLDVCGRVIGKKDAKGAPCLSEAARARRRRGEALRGREAMHAALASSDLGAGTFLLYA